MTSRYRQYRTERTTIDKNKLDEAHRRCSTPERFERMRVLNESLTVHFKKVHALCSREDFPLSAYPLLVQALRNEVNKGLNFDGGRFDEIFEAGARAEICNMVRERFNMDGKDPKGQKVGLLDRHHLMAWLVDPVAREWRPKFAFGADKAELVNEMIEMYVDLDEDGLSRTRALVKRQFMVRFGGLHLIITTCK